MTSRERHGGGAGAAAWARGPYVLFVVLVSAVWLAANLATLRGGTVHPETRQYIPAYLSDRPLLAILFDSRVNDAGLFRARELSYFLDCLDVRFIDLSIRAGHPHFLALSNYLALALLVAFASRLFSRDLGLPRAFAAGLVALFLTAPCVFFQGGYFRSSKIAVAAIVVVTMRQLRLWAFAGGPGSFESLPRATAFRRGLAFLALAEAACLLDEQGVFLVGMACAFLACHAFSPATRGAARWYALWGLVALDLRFVYAEAIGPALTQALNGYRPTLFYQEIPTAHLLREPGTVLATGALLMSDSISFLAGNLPWVFAGALAILVFVAFAYERAPGAARLSASPVSALSFCVVALLWYVMITGMYLRHEPVAWPDVRRVYYWLPFTAATVTALGLASRRAFASGLVSTKAATLGVWLLVVGNALSLPSHEAILAIGTTGESGARVPALVAALTHVRDPRFVPAPDVARDSLWVFFRERLGPRPQGRGEGR